MIGAAPHRRVAERFEDLASRLEAGLPPDADGAAETPAEWLRRRGHACAEHERIALEAGQTAGRAAEVLRRLSQGRRDRAAFVEDLTARLAYPATVLAAATGVTILLLALGVPLPRGWLVTLAGVALTSVLVGLWVRARLRDPAGTPDRLPCIGVAARGLGELTYLQTLHQLYGAGVPLRRAQALAGAAAVGPWLRARLGRATASLEHGEGFAASLAAAGAVCPETLRLLEDGERSGGLEDALRRAVERRRHEFVAWTRRAGRVVGTLAYLLAAGSVLWIAVSFYGAALGGLGR